MTARILALCIPAIMVIAFAFTMFYGWVLNIMALVHGASEFTVLVVLRIVGIFLAPLGSILGLFV